MTKKAKPSNKKNQRKFNLIIQVSVKKNVLEVVELNSSKGFIFKLKMIY